MYFDRKEFGGYLEFIKEFCWTDSILPLVKLTLSPPRSILGVIRILLSPAIVLFWLATGIIVTVIYSFGIPLAIMAALKFN